MRHEMTKPNARRTLLAVAGGLAAFTGASAEPDDEVRLEEVIVTARKLPESVGSVPLAINVLGTAHADSARIEGMQSISDYAPGFSYEPVFGASAGVPVLRGQAQPTAAGDNVAIFVDGVYQANYGVIDIEPLDLNHIELIRGPQSTMFGHSAFAGALQYVSNRPTRQLSRAVSVEGGTDAWFGAQGFLSGALGHSGWLGRVAASHRSADGTLKDANSTYTFGAFERNAVAVMLSRDTSGPGDWYAELGYRMGSNHQSLAALSRLSSADYNCGSQSSTSGLWSYYCGRAPIATQLDLSDDLPDTSSRHDQVLLHVSVPFAALTLESDSSYYWSRNRDYRDDDASSAGQLLGVCVVGSSCPSPGSPVANVQRFARVNEVDSGYGDVRELSQDFRLHATRGNLNWLLGATWFETKVSVGDNFAAARGDLAPNELYTAVLPATPDLVGPPVDVVNLALADDPAKVQYPYFSDEWRRYTLAGYAALDWRPIPALALRAELRQTHERFWTRSITAFFAPNTDPQPPPQNFNYTDPRLSADYAWSGHLHTWLSAAHGSRSGGINNTPGLDAAEQTFKPEYNWTYELGLRFAGDAALRSLSLTGYYIDWRDTQFGSWAATPGVFGWVTTNGPGVTTRGFEAAIALQPTAWLRTEFDYSYVDARFNTGTDYPGAADFCGLSPTSNQSNICTLGPPRQPAPAGFDLVPWIDGNELGRVPQTSWHAALILEPRLTVHGWSVGTRADFSYQDDMYENQIEHFRFGQRTLLDAQLWARHGHWSVELWGRNLTNERYIATAVEIDGSLFLTTPIPVDLIHGDGRRAGLTISYAD